MKLALFESIYRELFVIKFSCILRIVCNADTLYSSYQGSRKLESTHFDSYLLGIWWMKKNI